MNEKKKFVVRFNLYIFQKDFIPLDVTISVHDAGKFSKPSNASRYSGLLKLLQEDVLDCGTPFFV